MGEMCVHIPSSIPAPFGHRGSPSNDATSKGARLAGDDARQTAIHPQHGQVPQTQLPEHLIADIDRGVPHWVASKWLEGKVRREIKGFVPCMYNIYIYIYISYLDRTATLG